MFSIDTLHSFGCTTYAIKTETLLKNGKKITMLFSKLIVWKSINFNMLKRFLTHDYGNKTTFSTWNLKKNYDPVEIVIFRFVCT